VPIRRVVIRIDQEAHIPRTRRTGIVVAAVGTAVALGVVGVVGYVARGASSTGAAPPRPTSTSTATGTTSGPATTSAGAASTAAALGPRSAVFTRPRTGTPRAIGPEFFGMTTLQLLAPAVPFGAERLWDTGTTWAKLEPVRGRFEFGTLDRRVAAAQARRSKLLLTIGGTPTWASSRPTEATPYGPGASSPPRNPADFRLFMRTVAARYKGRIEAYEIWNEPDAPIFWHGTPAQLAGLTKIAYQEVKRADPRALVLMAGLNISKPSTTVTQMKGFFVAGGKAWIDAVCVHLYPTGGTSVAANAAHLARVRTLLANAKASKLPLWLCETGYGRVRQPPAVSDLYTGEQAKALVSRSYLEAAYAGLVRQYWYAYDIRSFVGLYLVAQDRRTPTAAATALTQTYRWMVGSRFLGCSVDSSRPGSQVWACLLQRRSGNAWAVWRVGAPASIVPPSGITRVVDLTGASTRVQTGRLIPVPQAPTLLAPRIWP
jgi:hypothetical protein